MDEEEPMDTTIIRSVRDTLNRVTKANSEVRHPAVTLAFAQSLDGCITACRGSSTAISGNQSLHMTHQLRSMHDAILVGINTVLVDDPRLTVRHVAGKSPIPIVLDSSLRTPLDAKLLGRDTAHRAIIVTLPTADREKEMALVNAGARVVRMPRAPGGGIRLSDLFRWLRKQNLKSLMIEGGARVISSVLAERLGDQLVLTIAPTFFGKKGLRAVEGLECVWSESRPCLSNVEVERIGSDLVIRGNLSAPAVESTDTVQESRSNGLSNVR